MSASISPIDLSGLPEAIIALIEKLQATIKQLEATVKHQSLVIEKLTLDLAITKRQLFGRSSESSTQLGLFEDDSVITTPPNALLPTTPARSPETKVKVPAAERGIRVPNDLPVERTVIDLPDAEKVAADGQMLTMIGTDISRKLAIKPGMFYWNEIVRPKYADLNAPSAGVKIAALPAQAIDGGKADASLLGHVAIAKFADHLPLNRIREGFARDGVHIPKQTLSDWMLAVGFWLRPLFDCLRSKLLLQPKIHVDETIFPLQGTRQNARAWTFVGSDPKIILYQFTTDKAGHHVRDFLRAGDPNRSFRGYLQADAASNYDALFRDFPHIIEVACHAHARRKFFEIARHAKPGDRPILATEAVRQIDALFAIERAPNDLPEPPEIRFRRRQSEAIPALAELKAWLDKNILTLIPKSPTAKAIGYCLKNWVALTRYTEQPYLSIDNNAAERALREIAIGRKNWLFAGSEDAGIAACVMTSLIETAKANGINPQPWLVDVLRKLPQMKSNQSLEELLPLS